MKYHKIRNIPLDVCTCEAKIAYNLAFLYATDYRDAYKKNASNVSEIAVSELVSEAIYWCMKMWKTGEPYQTTPDKYSIDLIFGCLNAGMENYFKGDYAILSSYEEVGKIFPSLYRDNISREMAKRKKLTEKEWKRQLEEKAAFEASEKEAKEAAIYSALRSAQIGSKIVEKSTPDFPESIVKIECNDCADDYDFEFECWTDCGNRYDINDFFEDFRTGASPAVTFVPEQEEEQDSDQLTFDDLAAMISANEAAEPSTVSPNAARSVTIGGKAGASPDIGTACKMSAPFRPAPNRSKTARRRLWWGVGVPPNGFEKLRRGVVVAAWWRGCVKNCTGRGVGRHGAARAAPT